MVFLHVLLHFQVTDVNYADFLTIQKKYKVGLGETPGPPPILQGSPQISLEYSRSSPRSVRENDTRSRLTQHCF